jgi:hypothetical protein
MTIELNIIDSIIYQDKEGRNRAERSRAGYTPKIIVLHVQEGTNDLAEYFKGVDADCTVWSKRDGQLIRILPDEAAPWTNGVFSAPNLSIPLIADAYRRGIYANNISLSIEHQGFYTQDFTDTQLESTSRMIATWCLKWDIPCDAGHIIGHRDIDSVTRANCPGPRFPFDRVITRANQLIGQEQGQVQGQSQDDPNAHYFPETGFWVVNNIDDNQLDFYSYWKRVGLSQLGYPISPAEYSAEFGRIVQWFERGRLEYHPEIEQAEYHVLEGLSGRETLVLKAENVQLKAELAALKSRTN